MTLLDRLAEMTVEDLRRRACIYASTLYIAPVETMWRERDEADVAIREIIDELCLRALSSSGGEDSARLDWLENECLERGGAGIGHEPPDVADFGTTIAPAAFYCYDAQNVQRPGETLRAAIDAAMNADAARSRSQTGDTHEA